LVSTGIALGIPEGNYGRIAPRSGLSYKNGIDIGAGVIDSDYTGEIKVLLINISNEPFEVEVGDRIAQIIIGKYLVTEIEEVEKLDESERGDAGFGSTGVKQRS